MQRLIVLHTNDTHGRVDGLARVATLVDRFRSANPETPVLYFDCGDVEEPSQRLSNVTKGAVMHRLLGRSGCDAAVVGNGAWIRYGPGVLSEQSSVAPYPLLLANLRKRNGGLLDGVRPATIVEAAGVRLGLIGLSAEMVEWAVSFDIIQMPVVPLAEELTADLQHQGAHAVIILSHLGLRVDREIAPALSGRVIAIIGAHSHDLLPQGEKVDGVWVAQAGQYAEHIGRIDLEFDEGTLRVTQVSTIEVTDDIPPSPAVLAEAQLIEAEAARFLDEVIGELAEPLDFALDRECGVANLMADVLLDRMKAELAIVAAGQAFTGPLPAGPLRRGVLWDVCNSTANPALVTLSGARLQELVERGLDPAFAQDRPRMLRGQQRGLFHLSGASVVNGGLLVRGRALEPERSYRVAGSDWEFEPYGGYAPKEWGLQPEYDVPTIMREALEEYLSGRPPVTVEMGRLDY